MIYSCVPSDVIFSDNMQIKKRQVKMYDNVSFEIIDGCVDRIVSTNPYDFIKYHDLLGTDKI